VMDDRRRLCADDEDDDWPTGLDVWLSSVGDDGGELAGTDVA
jgi:hypothetical protein